MSPRAKILLVALLAGGATGMLVRTRPSGVPAPAIAVTADPARPTQAVFQNDVAKCSFQIENLRTEPVTVPRIHVSCGCMQVLGPDGKALKTPFQLEARQVLPCTVDVDTRGKTGGVVSEIVVDAESSAGPTRVRLPVPVEVRPRCLVKPVALRFSSQEPAPLQALLEVKIPIDSRMNLSQPLELSDPSRFTVRVEPVAMPAEPVRAVTGLRDWVRVDYQLRYRLHVTYHPPDLTATTVDFIDLPLEGAPAIRVPVSFYAAPCSLRFQPEQLTVQESDTFQRRSVLLTGTRGLAVRFPDPPAWITLGKQTPLDDSTVIELVIDSVAARDPEPRLVAECGAQHRVLAVQIFSADATSVDR